MDPAYFSDPERFDPDRFSPEEKSKRDTCTWLPFGDGPKTCIGMRFGLMQIRVGLFTILKNFELTLGDKMPKSLEFLPTSHFTVAQNGIDIKLKPIL